MTPPDPQELLSTDAWIRRLAARLVRDPAIADDVVQDAWVVALGSERWRERSWFAGVLRNLVRGRLRQDSRRAAREARAAEAREQAPAEPDELVEELTLRRELSNALLELDEPYRRTLWLRFFHDRSVSRIARDEGVPVSTVHDRMKRGLHLLGRRLDRAYGDDRRAWAVALLTLATPKGVAATLIGGTLMGTGTKLLVSTAVAGGALFWALQTEEPSEPPRPPEEEVVRAQEPAPVEEIELARSEAEREGVTAPVPASTPWPELDPTAAPALTLGGRVMDTAGRAMAAVEVGFVDEFGSRVGQARAETDASGRFALPRTESPGAHVVGLDPNHVTLVRGAAEASSFLGLGEEALVVLAPKADFAGVVVDEDGAPIFGASVAFQVRQSLFRTLGIPRPVPPDLDAWERTTAEDGAFRLEGIAGGEHVGLAVEHPGFQRGWVDLDPRGDGALVVVLARQADEVELPGRVVDSQGLGVPGASVSAGSHIVTTDANGEFLLPWKAGDAGPYERGSDGVWRRSGDTSTLRAVKAGYLPAVEKLVAPDPDRLLLLRLEGEALRLFGRVVDHENQPVEGAVVWSERLQPFGEERIQSADGMAVHQRTLEELMRGDGPKRGAVTEADGSFELGGLLDKEYSILVLDPGTLVRGGPFRCVPGEEVELVLPVEERVSPVAGRVVDARGEPLVGVRIRALRTASQRGVLSAPRLGESLTETTDGEGRFGFGAMALAGTQLELMHDDLFLRHVNLDDFDEVDDLELVEPRLCDVEIDLSAEPELADEARILDAEGEELELLISHGVFLSMGHSVSIEDGKSGRLRVRETAETLVLFRGEDEVLRRPVSLDPDEVATLRP